ncbi:DNA-binding transcriptional regulator HexR [Salmonella bongori]|nr:DNA-binding transcriptional regulator HexR [Salmonella bongori]
MNKFFRFNVPVIYSDDIVLQRMSCMNCSDDDVVVLISHTGRTKSLVELAQLARENDAMVIALTSAGTPLAREATLAITLDVPEDTDIYMPMVFSTCSTDRDRCSGNGIYIASRGKIQR